MPAKTWKTFPTEIKAEAGGRTFRGVISTNSIDRDGDVVLPGGVDLRDFFKAIDPRTGRESGPVLLQHASQSLPIARVLKGDIAKFHDRLEARGTMEPRPQSLPANIEWPPDTILDMFKQGAPLSFSVGFLVKDGGSRGATSKDQRRFGKGVRRIITDWSLLEFSVVTIPANQDAVLVAVDKADCPVGSWTKGALGVDRLGPKVTVTHRRVKPRLRLEDMPKEGTRLRLKI